MSDPANAEPSASEELADKVRRALQIVIDPELGLNIVDLGLVHDLAVEGGLVRITMTTTTRGCPAASFLKEGAHASVCTVPGVETVDVTLTYDPPWRPQMMSAEAKQHLGIGNGDGW